jgi:hypothetical protein
VLDRPLLEFSHPLKTVDVLDGIGTIAVVGKSLLESEGEEGGDGLVAHMCIL